MATIRHSLQTEIFRAIDERLMTFVHVYKPYKKKKTSNFLCLTVTKEAPIVFYIHQIKKTEKNILKKKRCWVLSALRVVDGISDSSTDEKGFDLHFDKVYKWSAVNLQERQTFLVILWKQCMNSMTGAKPEFRNLPKEWLISYSNDLSTSLKPETGSTGDNVVLIEPEEYQALTEKEENDLEKMMLELGFTPNNAEEFVEKLTNQLTTLDEENLQSVLSSEHEVAELINKLDLAINEIENLESQLSSYDEILDHVRTTIEKMEQKNALIKVVNENNEKLLSRLEKVVNQLELSPKHQAALVNADLTSPSGLRDAISAAKELQAVMNAKIHPTLVQLTAVQDQKKQFDRWKSKFSHTLSRHLNNLFIHIGNDTSKLKLSGTELYLPVCSQFHKELSAYTPLMHWCKVMDRKAYIALMRIYTSSLGKLYERHIKQFMEEAKRRVVTDRLNSFTEDSRRTSISGKMSSSNSSGLLGIERDQWVQEVDLEERARFDQILEIVLSQLEPVCLSEQNFCIAFFQLDVLSPSTKNTQTTLDGFVEENRKFEQENLQISQKKIDKKINEEVRKMMSDIFGCIEPELLNFITYHEKMDSVYCMSALIHFTEHVMSAQDTGSFLSITFGSVLVHVKRNFDKYMQTQEKSIVESRLPRKSKCGIIPFVSNFEEFANTAENIFKNTERRTDLDKWYVRLMGTMFETIQSISADHPKTPPEVVKMENFHHLYALLSQLKIAVLDSYRKEAKQKYNEALSAYVIRYFGRPLEKLNLFFEGVQGKVAQGVKESEISYQVAYSKQELRKVIREYPAREVKKGLDHLYKKVDKHLCEEENLLQVVWRAMQEEFIQQYKSIEDLIQRCYPGSMICLEFSIEDILQFFSEIARSH